MTTTILPMWPFLDSLRAHMERPTTDPDFNPQQDEIDRFAKSLAQAIAKQASVEIKNYNESGSGGGARGVLYTWLLGMLGASIPFILWGSYLVYGRLIAIETKVDNLQQQIIRLQNQSEPKK